jgi:hypothetical protein
MLVSLAGRATAILRISSIVAMLAMSACPPTGSPIDAGNSQPPSSCTLTVSGAIEASGPCVESTNYRNDLNATELLMIPTTNLGMTNGVSFQADLTGTPTANVGQFTAGPGVSFGFSVNQSGMQWETDYPPSGPEAPSFALTISSDELTLFQPGVYYWAAHGTVQGTLDPMIDTGASGTITFIATF